jgi:hypothetical protein
VHVFHFTVEGETRLMKVNQALIGLCPKCRQEMDNCLAEPAPLEIEIKHLWESPAVRESMTQSPLDIEAAVIAWTVWVDTACDGTLPVCDITAAQLFEYWVWLTARTSDYRKAACHATAVSWLVYTYWQMYDAGFMTGESAGKHNLLKNDKRRKPKPRAVSVRCDGRFSPPRK